MNKTFRKFSIVAAFLVLIGSLLVTQKFMGQKEAPAKKEANQERLRKVNVFPVQNEVVRTTVDLQGRLSAFNKIDIFTEVTGALEQLAKPFKIGTRFQEGELMLKIDNEEARLNLLSQKSSLLNSITQLLPDLRMDYPESFSQWKAYIDQFDLQADIQALPEPLNDQEKYFIISRNLHSQYFNIRSAETRLSKYQIHAPFSGVLTSSNINSGSLIRSGQRLGELMSTNRYELEATISLEKLEAVRPGDPVEIYSEELSRTWPGKVRRIGDQIDANTQNVILYVSILGQGLKEGMYLRGRLKGKPIDEAVKIPRNLLVNQQSVYTVRDSILALQNIEVAQIQGTYAIVKGIPSGTLLLSEPYNGIYDGMKVSFDLAPTPTLTSRSPE